MEALELEKAVPRFPRSQLGFFKIFLISQLVVVTLLLAGLVTLTSLSNESISSMSDQLPVPLPAELSVSEITGCPADDALVASALQVSSSLFATICTQEENRGYCFTAVNLVEDIILRSGISEYLNSLEPQNGIVRVWGFTHYADESLDRSHRGYSIDDIVRFSNSSSYRYTARSQRLAAICGGASIGLWKTSNGTTESQFAYCKLAVTMANPKYRVCAGFNIA